MSLINVCQSNLYSWGIYIKQISVLYISMIDLDPGFSLNSRLLLKKHGSSIVKQRFPEFAGKAVNMINKDILMLSYDRFHEYYQLDA